MKSMKLGALLLVAACSSATHEPPPVKTLAPGRAQGRTADQLVAEADAAWARRGQPGQAEAAQGLYLDAAAADEHRADALLGAMRALSFRIEHEPGVSKEQLSVREVELGQWCQRRAPNEPECDYRLALALGQQAREKPSTGKDALNKMVDLLHRSIARAPGLDSGGPHRVLALVLLRAPGWPLGPGDSEAALGEARAAVQIAPDAAPNQLVLGEALAANDKSADAAVAYRKAVALGTAARDAGDPEAGFWLAQARAAVGKSEN